MKAHFEANTKWLWKLFQVNTIPGRTEANCNINEMLTLCVFIIIHCDLFFSLQSKTNDSQVEAHIFSLKPLTEVGPSNKTVELPSMCSSFEINTVLKWMFSDANCRTLGLLCHLHTPAPCCWCSEHSRSASPASCGTVTSVVFGYRWGHPFKAWQPELGAVVPKSQFSLFLYKLWFHYHLTLMNQISTVKIMLMILRFGFQAKFISFCFEVLLPIHIIACLAPPLGYLGGTSKTRFLFSPSNLFLL